MPPIYRGASRATTTPQRRLLLYAWTTNYQMLSTWTMAYRSSVDTGSSPAETHEDVRRISERKSAETRREEILESTIRLVARKGFAAVTLRDVAADIGVAHGLLRHYFDSRDELIAAAFDRAVIEEMASAPTIAADAEPSRDALLRGVAEWLTATPRDHYLVWIDAWSEAPRNPALHESLRRHHVDCERRLAEIIDRGAASGHFTFPHSAAHVSRSLTAYADGLAVQQHAIGIIGAEEYDQIVFETAERMLGIEAGSLASAATERHTRGTWLDT